MRERREIGPTAVVSCGLHEIHTDPVGQSDRRALTRAISAADAALVTGEPIVQISRSTLLTLLKYLRSAE